MIASTEPTSTARWMEWIRSNSAATSPTFSARTAACTSASSARSAARSAPLVSAAPGLQGAPPGIVAMRSRTSPENTTAAAGAPPITDANEPSTASTVRFSLSDLENTTNAPPW